MSFLLDTDVLSEARKRTANPNVKAWLASVAGSELYLSVLVIGEIRQGIERMHRRDPEQAGVYEGWLSTLLRDYADRIAPITAEVAQEWGRLNVPDPLPVIDGLLAATARVRGWTLVTRNTADLARSGVRLLDPFEWLGRAYEQSTAPPRRRSPARPRAAQTTLPVVVHGSELPGRTCRPGPDGAGYQAVHVALCSRDAGRSGLDVPGRPWRATEPAPGDASAARWAFEITVRQGPDGLDYSGPFVRGNRGDRHIGLAWGEVPGDGTLRLFRGAKLPLADVGGGILAEAMRPGHQLVARVRLTDAKGLPICARVRPPDVAWSAEPVDA